MGFEWVDIEVVAVSSSLLRCPFAFDFALLQSLTVHLPSNFATDRDVFRKHELCGYRAKLGTRLNAHTRDERVMLDTHIDGIRFYTCELPLSSYFSGRLEGWDCADGA